MNVRRRVFRWAFGLLALTLALPQTLSGYPLARAASLTLVISEVLYDPIGVEPDGEWIEVYNLGSASITLTNYKVGDEETSGGTEGMMRFPTGASIAPGATIVVANRASAFSAAYGFKPNYEMLESDPTVPNMANSGWASGSVALHNDSDEVLLLDGSNKVVDALSWGSSTFAFAPPAPDVAEGHALERRPANRDADAAGDWIDQSAPAPGHVVLRVVQVVSPADSGPGTLRQALLDAAAGDAITFSPAVFPPGSPVTIFVQSFLPPITRDNVAIDASNAGVILDGSQASAGTNGLTVQASHCVVQGLFIQRFTSNGVLIASGAATNAIGGDRGTGSGPNGQGNLIAFNGGSGIEVRGDGNRVLGNYIGVDGAGTSDWGNAYNGVVLWQGASDNVVGGTTSDYRNVIGGNDHNGVWISGTGSDQNVVVGNYIGARADGLGPLPNGFSGVSIQGGAQSNRIGGTASGAGNLISGNTDNGVYISDAGTINNQVLGNVIGPDRRGIGIIGQGYNGVVIALGANRNAVGDGSPAGRNLISGNSSNGVRIEGSDTMSNTAQGNYIGTNLNGDATLGNGAQGIEITQVAHDNRVEGNVLSGNGSNGIIIVGGAHHNVVCGNLIGTDKTGTFAVGGQTGGGVDLASGAHHNTIGGPTAAERNVISGNGVDGVFIEGWETMTNTVQGNYIGTDASGVAAVPNSPWGLFILNGAPGNLITDNVISHNAGHGMEITYSAMDSRIVSNTIAHNGGAGIHFTQGASLHQVMSNTIASNSQAGVLVEHGCTRNSMVRNSIYDNGGPGIRNLAFPGPTLTVVATDTITGTTTPNARLEFFSDDDDEGRAYEGFTLANASGVFSFTQPGGFTGPNLTATSTDAGGNTSEFSLPAHLLWTLLLYLNGDNDLEEFMFDTLTNIVVAGPSLRANVLALVDGYTTTSAYSGTVLYDVTRGQATPLSATLTITGERNMGDGQTLVDLVTWGRAHYPARYTLLAIVDHGGGWAPGNEMLPGALARSRVAWMAGSSGLSWDFSSDYDYLDSREIRQAMSDATNSGADPLDVIFYDVCLMGMLEVAYQIKDYAAFFVSSQNIGWAPVGPAGRYVQTIQGIEPTATPRQMAELVVQAYADATPPQEHPFTVSAVDLASLSTMASAVNQLAEAISQTLASPAQAATLGRVYSETQKLDYDSDLRLEQATDGFVDLYDLGLNASRQFTAPAVIAAARAVTSALEAAIVAEAHRSGSPWIKPDQVWDLDDVHGLSVFLPLGEDLELPIVITETSPITPGLVISRNLRLREMYASDQLQFVEDTAWGALIDAYYRVVSSPVPTGTTEGPVDGPQNPDVTPPQTTITVTGVFTVGKTITVTWVTTDAQTGPLSGTLWHQPPSGSWSAVLTQGGSSGVFTFVLLTGGENRFAVCSTDKAGNLEPLNHGPNTFVVRVEARVYLPLILKL